MTEKTAWRPIETKPKRKLVLVACEYRHGFAEDGVEPFHKDVQISNSGGSFEGIKTETGWMPIPAQSGF